MLKQGEWRGSKLTGLAVYNNNDERVGEINDLIVGKDGKLESVVLGVGGFLGIGEHDVAVPFSRVKFVEEPRRAERTTSRTDERSRNEAAGARNDAAARMDANRTATTNAPAANTLPNDRAPETTATTTMINCQDARRPVLGCRSETVRACSPNPVGFRIFFFSPRRGARQGVGRRPSLRRRGLARSRLTRSRTVGPGDGFSSATAWPRTARASASMLRPFCAARRRSLSRTSSGRLRMVRVAMRAAWAVTAMIM